MGSKISRLVILSSGDQWPNRRGDPEKTQKKSQHSPLSARARGVTFTGRVPFRALLHREFQVTALTVNHTKTNRGESILLSKYIPLDGHGGHLQTPM